MARLINATSKSAPASNRETKAAVEHGARFLVSPVVNPWYLLWLLPLEIAAGRAAGLVFSVTILAAYAPLAGWLTDRTWSELPLASSLIHVPVWLVLVWEVFPRLREHVGFPWLRPRLGKIQ